MQLELKVVRTRVRRGVVVEIPRKWINRVPSKSTMADRKKAANKKRLLRRRRLVDEYEFVEGSF